VKEERRKRVKRKPEEGKKKGRGEKELRGTPNAKKEGRRPRGAWGKKTKKRKKKNRGCRRDRVLRFTQKKREEDIRGKKRQ